jgi:ribonuclease Z
MRPSFHPRLVNGPFQDPGLLVAWAFRKRAVLFDLGDLSSLSPVDILKVSHVFISHTHMDHFIGFDQLIRLMLGRAKKLSLFGPPGILENVTGKLQGYTWNLVANYPDSLVLDVIEVDSNQRKQKTFDCRSGFRPGGERVTASDEALLIQDEDVVVSFAILDHGIPSLAFRLEEPFHINVLKTRMEAMGLTAGPWINHFKQLLYAEADNHTPLEIPMDEHHGSQRVFALGDLAQRIARITAGQKIAYVADAVYNSENKQKIISLASDVDHLFIEGAFMHADKETAHSKHHLTAHQAGYLARLARAKKMTVFHHSPRYHDQAHLLKEEAQRAFTDS